MPLNLFDQSMCYFYRMAKDASNYGHNEHPRENCIFEDVTLKMNQSNSNKEYERFGKDQAALLT
jgi:hypothetical protein